MCETDKMHCIELWYRKIPTSPGAYICSKGLSVIFLGTLYVILDGREGG